MTRSILKGTGAERAWGTLAGMMTASPEDTTSSF